MYWILEPFRQHDPSNVGHIQGNTEWVESIDRHSHTVTVPDPLGENLFLSVSISNSYEVIWHQWFDLIFLQSIIVVLMTLKRHCFMPMRYIYRKFSNKGIGRWSKDMGVPLLKKRPSPAPRGLLHNENRTIFSWDMAKTANFLVKGPLRNQGAPLLGEAPLLENLRYMVLLK